MKLCKAIPTVAVAVIGGTAAAQATHTVPGDHPDIPSAIAAAASGDTILVDPGVYTGTVDFAGKDVVLQSTGGPGATALDGNLTDTVVVFASGESAAAVLDGFTVWRGRPSVAPVGGIYCKDSSPTIRNCVIRLNRAVGGTGAILCDNAAPTVVDCELRRNYGGARPGGPSAGGVTCENGSSFTAVGCQFRFNEGLTYDLGGGEAALHCVGQSSASFQDCEFTGNLGGRGGRAGAGVGSFEDSTGVFTDCTFEGNLGGPGGLDAGHRGGDGVLDLLASDVTLTRCALVDNAAGVEGGDGALHGVDSVVTIVESSFSANAGSPGANDAGAGAIGVAGASSLSVRDSTFDGNLGATGPGAIDIRPGPSFELTDTVFSANQGAGAAHASGALGARAGGLVVGCSFLGNIGAPGAAGAATLREGGLVRASRFENNRGGAGVPPKAGAGAIELQGQVPIVLRACEFTDNVGGAFPGGIGGAGAIALRGPHDSLIENCLVWLNQGGDGDLGGAGALSVNSGSQIGRPVVQNSTLTRNVAGQSSGAVAGAGAVHVSELAEPTLVNTIAWNDSGGPEVLCTSCGGGPVVTHCVVEGGYPGVGNLDADPRFVGPLAENFRLQCPSPARDAGTSSGISMPPRDLDGLPRVLDDEVDIGAYEVVSPGAGTRYCVSTVNSTGFAALIDGGGCNRVGEQFLPLRARPVPNSVGLFYYGPAQIQIPYGDGFRCVGGGGGAFYRLRLVAAHDNELKVLLEYLSPHNPAGRIFAGSVWNFQGVFRDPSAGGAEFNLSDAIQIMFVQ